VVISHGGAGKYFRRWHFLWLGGVIGRGVAPRANVMGEGGTWLQMNATLQQNIFSHLEQALHSRTRCTLKGTFFTALCMTRDLIAHARAIRGDCSSDSFGRRNEYGVGGSWRLGTALIRHNACATWRSQHCCSAAAIFASTIYRIMALYGNRRANSAAVLAYAARYLMRRSNSAGALPLARSAARAPYRRPSDVWRSSNRIERLRLM